MNSRLIGLIISGVILPLVLFVGNLKAEVSEAEGHEETGETAEAAAEVNAAKAVQPQAEKQTEAFLKTPEIYFGYSSAQTNLGNEEGFRPEAVVSYTAPQSYDEIAPNTAYVGGQWRNNADSLELVSGEGRIALKYAARAVNIVASHGQQPSLLQVLVDEKLVDSTNRGSDVEVTKADAVVTVDEQRLYSLVADSDYRTRVIELNVKGKGFRIYAFTFG